MSPRITAATAGRVLTQLRRDPRTVGLILLVPVLLMTLLRYAFDAQPETFDRIGGSLIGAVGNAVLGMSLGLFLSAFATTEFQAVQFMPAFVFPQLLLCGLFVSREKMAEALQTAADALPLTYAFDALDRVTTDGSLGSRGCSMWS